MDFKKIAFVLACFGAGAALWGWASQATLRLTTPSTKNLDLGIEKIHSGEIVSLPSWTSPFVLDVTTDQKIASIPPAPKDREDAALWIQEFVGKTQALAREHLQIHAAELPVAFLNEPYQVRLSSFVLGGIQPYRFELIGGALPAGIVLDAHNGVLYGRSEAEAVEWIRFRVTDEAGNAQDKELWLAAAKRSATSGGENFELIPTTLPKTVVGQNYFAPIALLGGVPPFLFEADEDSLPPGLHLHDEQGMLYGQPTRYGIYVFRIHAADQSGAKTYEDYQLQVDDSPLYLTSGKLSPGWVGLSYFDRLRAEGGSPPYTWSVESSGFPRGLTFDPETGALSGIPTELSRMIVIFSVRDQDGNFDSATFSLLIQGEHLEILDAEPPKGVVGRFYHHVLRAKGGRVPYVWSLKNPEALPLGLEFQQETHALVGIPREGVQDELYFQLTDQSGQAQEKSFVLEISETSLSVHVLPFLRLSVGDALFYAVHAEGGEPEYEWDLMSGAPRGISLLEHGTFFGVPVQAERTVTRFRVTDQSAEAVTEQMLFEVVNRKFSMLTDSLPRGTYNEPYFAQLSARGGTLPYLWRATNLPVGLLLDRQIGAISGTPRESGVFHVTVAVQDATGRTTTQKIFLHVQFEPLKFLTRELPKGAVHVPYEKTCEVSGGIEPYAWHQTSGVIPRGLRFDQETCTLYGTPLEGSNVTLGIQVTDALGARATQLYRFVIDGEKLEWITETLPRATVSIPYHYTLSAKGGILPYTWLKTSDISPSFLSLDPDAGTMSGTPEVPGTFFLTVRVQDVSGRYVDHAFTLNILPKPLTIENENESLATATVGAPYDKKLEVSGGTPPYTWALVAGKLPQGLKLNSKEGIISGIPTEEGIEELTLRVTDADLIFIERTYTLKVEGVLPPPIRRLLVAPSDSKVGLAWTLPDDARVTEIRIYRARGGWPEIGRQTLIFQGREDQWLDLNLINGQTYYYVILTYNAGGQHSEISDAVRGSATPLAVTLTGPGDPFADGVVSFHPLSEGGWGASQIPNNVLGPPGGPAGGNPAWSPREVVSLHARTNDDEGASPPYGGSITLEFHDNIIVNGSGDDFTVFENVFVVSGSTTRYIEPAVVSVSQDGHVFYPIPFDYQCHLEKQDDHVEGHGRGEDCVRNNPFAYQKGFAGINPVYSVGLTPDPTDPNVSGGDPFDLSDVRGKKLQWVRFVKIQSTGDGWLRDQDGELVHHTNNAGTLDLTGNYKSGFDLDAVSAIHV